MWNLPRTAHGKLNAVITPTIPRGFQVCIPSKWKNALIMEINLINQSSKAQKCSKPLTSYDWDLLTKKVVTVSSVLNIIKL